MQRVSASVWVPVRPHVAFAVSQTTGAVRLRWDPFVRHQHLIDSAAPGKGIRTFTKARVGPTMISRYVSYRPPISVGMTMESGPWFFTSFSGGWRFKAEVRGGQVGTRVVWRYSYAVPRRLRLVGEPLGRWVLAREIQARIAAYARACEDPVVLAAARPV